MVVTCAACHEPIDVVHESSQRWNNKDYHNECLDTGPRVTPRTQHIHVIGWGSTVEHVHANGKESHEHPEFTRDKGAMGELS